jgi:putative transposase
MTKEGYATNFTDKQWDLICGKIPGAKNRGRPQSVDRRRVVDAILYLVRTGCQWRMLPKDFPHWKTVANIFYQWRDSGVWQEIHDALVRQVRKAEGREEYPSAAILDSQSVKTTEVGGVHGYDGGKKVNGRKRNVIVDTLGLLWAVAVTPADMQDQDSGCFALSQMKHRSRRLSLIWADSAYGRNALPEWVRETFGWILQIVLRPIAVKGWVHLPKRWIVERTFGWIGRSRRHSKDYERNPRSSETLILIAMIQLMLRRLT